jgi:CRISPR-associated protein Cmr2
VTSYLIAISIGPVQNFIAAARRTRDLWFGSHLLSEISKAAARAIAEEGGKLIFPALEKNDLRLLPSEDMDAFNVANIILAELQDGSDPEFLRDRAYEAAQSRWVGYARGARNETEKFVRGDLWNEQVNDVIAFYSAWVPLGDDEGASRERLMHLLSGRKVTRDFIYAKGCAGILKSSLDGARESVLDKRKVSRSLALKMRLAEGEQLCAVGSTKRLGGKNVAFPSVIRVAADPWIRGVKSSGTNADNLLQKIIELCEGKNGFSSGTGRFYGDFPYDGQVLYPSRLYRLMNPKRDSDAYENLLDDTDMEKLKAIKKIVDCIQKKENGGLGLGVPDPYLAVLMADGDRMGATISQIDTAKDHRAFSAKLAEFAGQARSIIEGHNGCLVYSGGDDVLAFLPVDMCLKAARKLHDKFGELLKDYPTGEAGAPTLSVGIAIGHFMEPLEDLLIWAREAEKASKTPDRNGLAIHFHARAGGDPIQLRDRWQDADGMDWRLDRWSHMHLNNEIPDKAAYDIHQLAEDYKGWDWVDKDELCDLIRKDLKRLLKRKKSVAGLDELSDDKIKSMIGGVDPYEAIRRLADELILARKLAENMEQAQNRFDKKEVDA